MKCDDTSCPPSLPNACIARLHKVRSAGSTGRTRQPPLGSRQIWSRPASPAREPPLSRARCAHSCVRTLDCRHRHRQHGSMSNLLKRKSPYSAAGSPAPNSRGASAGVSVKLEDRKPRGELRTMEVGLSSLPGWPSRPGSLRAGGWGVCKISSAARSAEITGFWGW